MPTIKFETKLFKIRDWTILLLPEDASAKLPSRGMVMVKGNINDYDIHTLLEPDGNGSHWLRVDEDLQKAIQASSGDTVTAAFESTKEWSKPEVPEDLQKALVKAPKAKALWDDITPNAQWEWIRWIRGVRQEETRKQHIEVALSKLNSGMRRPCCFNRNMCSEPYVVSKNWALAEPV